MSDLLRAAVLPYGEAQGIGDLEPAGESHLSRHGVHDRAAERLAREVLVPREPVTHGGPQTAGADDAFIRHLDLPAARRAAIGLPEPGDHAAIVAAPRRVRESQRLEDAQPRECLEVHAAHALDEGAREDEAGVGVRVVIADRIVDRPLRREQEQQIGLRVGAAVARPPLPRHETPPVAQATGMGEQVAHGHGAPIRRQLREILPGVVLEGHLAIGDQQHHGRCGELLGDRARLQDGGGDNRPVPIEVRHAVAALEQRGGAPRDPHGASRAVRIVPRRKDSVGGGHERRPRCAGLGVGDRRRQHGREESRQRAHAGRRPQGKCTHGGQATARRGWRHGFLRLVPESAPDA